MITGRIFEEAMRFEESGGTDWMVTVPLAVYLTGGEPGYVVFDRSEERVTLYAGEEGRQGYLRWSRLLQGDALMREERWQEQCCTPHLTLSFAPEQALTQDEAAFCHRRCAAEDRPQKERWPMLRRTAPFVLHDEVDGALELLWIEEALAAVNWFRANANRLPSGRVRQCAQRGEMPELTPEGDGYRVRFVPIPAAKRRIWPMPAVPADLQKGLSALTALPHDDTWELQVVTEPPEEKVFDDGTVRPECLGEGLLTAVRGRASRGRLLLGAVITDFARDPGHLLRVLTQRFLLMGEVPEEILARDELTQMFLSPWCSCAGVKLRRMSEPEIGQMREDMGLEDPAVRFGRVLEREERTLLAGKRPITSALRDLAKETQGRILAEDWDRKEGMPQELFNTATLLDDLGLLPREVSEVVLREKATGALMQELDSLQSGFSWEEGEQEPEELSFSDEALVIQVMAKEGMRREIVINAMDTPVWLARTLRQAFSLADVDPDEDVLYIRGADGGVAETLSFSHTGPQSSLAWLGYLGEWLDTDTRFLLRCRDAGQETMIVGQVTGKRAKVEKPQVRQVSTGSSASSAGSRHRGKKHRKKKK